jgi:hypothetical protein
MTRNFKFAGSAAVLILAVVANCSDDAVVPDLRSVAPDLCTPPVVSDAPAPGKRVRQVTPEYAGTNVHHALYLPIEWKPGGRYPVIVEYPGNGPYVGPYGDRCEGTVEGCNLGYGISGGRQFIWISMPFVDEVEKTNQPWWWGDVNATIRYCKTVVRQVCEDYGGDPASVILTGFSRGAIACNYIGLHDDEIADVWLAFIPYSHYDGVRRWDWAGSDRPSARERLGRIGTRASFITQEVSTADIQEYIKSSGATGSFTFQPIPFRNHNDAWTLRDMPERRALREWLQRVLRERPGVHGVSGCVRDARGAPVAGVRIQSGYTHWTYTDTAGRYELAGLMNSTRTVTPAKPGYAFSPAQRSVDLPGTDAESVEFTGRLQTAR